MTVEIIRHKRVQGKFLEYEPLIGPRQEISASNGSLALRAKALYADTDIGYVGVRGSQLGPELFVNGEVYPFSDASWDVDVELVRDDQRLFRMFRMTSKGRVIHEIVYTSPPVDELDPWSDDESEDIFVWVGAKRHSDEFFELWSQGAETKPPLPR